MCAHESKWLDDCPVSFKPVFYQCYIDDTFVLFNFQNHAVQCLNYLNSKHPNIKFTMDAEKDGKISFLDVSVSCKYNTFTTSVFLKDAFSGQGTSYISYCLFKINAIKAMIFCAYHISSDYLNLHNEFNFLVDFFSNKGFPKFICYLKYS